MLTGQIGTLGGLGAAGRGIQQRGLDAQYKAATQMSDEPFMRMQRGFQVLGQGQPFMPSYSSGFGTGSAPMGAFQKPNAFSRVGAGIGMFLGAPGVGGSG